MHVSMLLGLFDWMESLIGKWIGELLSFIPKLIYMLYASAACLLDILQLFFRKLAGLDIYYIANPENPKEPIAQSGDIVYNFVTSILGINESGQKYSVLTTVFWSMILFGVIILFATTFIAIIKSHYSYDEKVKTPMQFVYTAGKALINIAATPILIVLGLYISQAILTSLDSITASSSSEVSEMFTDKSQMVGTQVKRYGKDETTYCYYDIFGYGESAGRRDTEKRENKLTNTASTSMSFSGALFKLAAYDANRCRREKNGLGPGVEFTGNGGGGLNIFHAATKEEMANKIDMAFANFIHLDKNYNLTYLVGKTGQQASLDIVSGVLGMTNNVESFSKFRVGLVWYYYDLWNFNFVVGFASVAICFSLFINIIFGLMIRLFMCIGLFLIAPPMFALAPLDGGKASKSFRENFMKQALSVIGAVVGMNLFFLILPYINEINFFGEIAVANYFAQVLVIIAGLITIKSFISVVSGMIGAEDLQKSGGEGLKDASSTIAKGAATAAKIGKGAFKFSAGVVRGGFALANWRKERKEALAAEGHKTNVNNMEEYKKRNDLMREAMKKKIAAGGTLNEEDFMEEAMDAGLNETQAGNMYRALTASATGNDINRARAAYMASASAAAGSPDRDQAFLTGMSNGWNDVATFKRQYKEEKRLSDGKTARKNEWARRQAAGDATAQGILAREGVTRYEDLTSDANRADYDRIVRDYENQYHRRRETLYHGLIKGDAKEGEHGAGLARIRNGTKKAVLAGYEYFGKPLREAVSAAAGTFTSNDIVKGAMEKSIKKPADNEATTAKNTAAISNSQKQIATTLSETSKTLEKMQQAIDKLNKK